MLWKVLTLVGAALALYSFARRAMGAARPPAPPARRADGDVADLVRCPACGSWVDAATSCACRTPPTP